MARAQVYREVVPGFEISDQEIQDAIQNKSDIARRINFKKRKNMLQDKLYDQVDGVLRSMFKEPSYIELKKYIDVSCNLMKRLNKEVSLVYQREPERVTTKANQKRLEEIVSESHMDLLLSKANYYLNGLNDLILFPMVMGNEVSIGMLTPDQVIVFQNADDPSIAEALLIEGTYKLDANTTKAEYIFWSPTRHFVVRETKDGMFEKIFINEDGSSPYKEVCLADGAFYPFVFCHADYRIGEFWDENAGTSLQEATLLVAIQNTFKHFMVPQQFKQLAVKMITKDDNVWNNAQISNPLHIFTTNGEMQVLDWQSAIDKLDTIIGNKITAIANDIGVSAEQMKLQIQAQSGFARLIAKERLLEVRDEQIKYWRLYEIDLFNAIRAVNNVYSLGKPMAPDPKYHIDFAEPKMLTDPMEDLNIKQKKINMGLLSPVEIIMQENPDLKTREEAIKAFEQNISDRNLVLNDLGLRFDTPNLNGNNNNQEVNNGQTK